MDQMLLDLAAAGVSSQEISERTNGALSPVRVEARIRQIIKNRTDSLSAFEQRFLLIHDLQRLKQMLWDMIEEGDDDRSDLASTMVQTLKLVGDRIDVMAKEADDTKERITKYQAGVWIKALELVYENVIDRLAKQYPDVDVIVLREMVNEELPRAFEQIEAETGE